MWATEEQFLKGTERSQRKKGEEAAAQSWTGC